MKKNVFLAGLMLMLAGCATPPPAPAPTAAQQKQLIQLQKAFDTGVITRDQYEAQRKKILAPHS